MKNTVEVGENMKEKIIKKHYGAIDGLRMLAAFGIVMMHIRANSNYEIRGEIYNTIIPSFTNFVSLFMIVSAFGMCCGYYEKVLNQQVNYSDFYSKRFKKIIPFFGLLVLIDIVMSPSVGALYEAFADLTLLFGFLPGTKSISVIGVGWFLGLIFVFYICFPFFCVLIQTKRRAWFSFIVSLIWNFVCINYFETGSSNILCSACFFIAGGLIYLYRSEIAKFNDKIAFVLMIIMVISFYLIGDNTITCLGLFSIMLVYAILKTGGLLENPITRFFSNISMEIYLSHMLIFRVVERVGVNRMMGNGWIQYIVTVIVVLCGTTIFSILVKKIIQNITRKIEQKNRVERL